MPVNFLGAHLPWSSRDQYLEKILDLGLIPEIAFKAHDFVDLNSAALDQLAGQLRESGRQPTVHAPFFDLNPGALEPLVRQASLQRLTQALHVADRLGARLMVIHPGFDPWRYPEMEHLWVEHAVSFFQELLAVELPGQCRLAIENIYEPTPETLVALVEACDSPRLGHCFDIGHWNMFGQISLDDWLDRVLPRLLHLHLHDNHGDSDAHLPIGQGNIDFTAFFARIFDQPTPPSMTLEAHSPADLEFSCRQFNARF